MSCEDWGTTYSLLLMSSPSKGSSFGKSLSPFANLQVQCTRFGLSYVFWLYLQVLWLDSGYWLFLLRGALPSIKESPVAQHIDITNASIRKLSRQQLQNQVLGHANDRVFQCSSWIEKFKKSLNLGWLEIDVLVFFLRMKKGHSPVCGTRVQIESLPAWKTASSIF